MYKKRGQVTIFLIFGFVILTAFLFLFYLNNQVKDIREKVETQMTLSDLTIPIKSYVDLCLRSTGEDALYLIGIQGGYFGMPSYKVDSKGVFYEAFHTVYLHNKKNVMPDIATIENEISEYVNENLDFCIKDFEDFKSQGYEIESSEFSTVASINRNNVAFSLDFPISLRKGGKSATMGKFFVEVPSRLDLIYNTAKNLTDDQLNHLDKICVSCLIGFGDSNDLYFELLPGETNLTLIMAEDNKTKLNNEPYIFIFAFNHSSN